MYDKNSKNLDDPFFKEHFPFEEDWIINHIYRVIYTIIGMLLFILSYSIIHYFYPP